MKKNEKKKAKETAKKNEKLIEKWEMMMRRRMEKGDGREGF